MSSDQVIAYQYTFRLKDGAEQTFDIRLDRRTLNLVQPERGAPPEWTRLGCCQCPHCPLDEREHSHCPVAVNLVDLVDFFSSSPSYDEIDVQLETDERRYAKHTTVQQGLSSLMGIYMVTSGCPVMDKLRPMVRFHQPFATREETVYRAVAMYLMAQYFRRQRGKEPDWEVKNLVHIYRDIQTVNQTFSMRLKQIESEDASTNALTILDCFANYIMLSIDENMLSDIEILFETYLKE